MSKAGFPALIAEALGLALMSTPVFEALHGMHWKTIALNSLFHFDGTGG